MDQISGFSKLTKKEKIDWIASQLDNTSAEKFLTIKRFWQDNEQEQKVFDEFSENTITNFIFPYGIAPNFKINNKLFCVPMVIEESSVVAAASKSAKFWQNRGGFKAEVISVEKSGQVHFTWDGEKTALVNFFADYKDLILNSVQDIVQNMEKRGGGVKDLELVDRTSDLENYYQLSASFNTCDAMGANFINSVLEKFATTFEHYFQQEINKNNIQGQLEIVMSILSNYTPNCLVKAHVECPINELGNFGEGIDSNTFATKFKRAVDIAYHDRQRAVTHNKGIFNGIDAVILATGNDFRSIEACGHAYAAKDGHYRSLTKCEINNDIFKFEIEIPIALGTIGGLTNLHPMAQTSLELLENPSAEQLMKIVACVGLAQNFGAIQSLVTTGIQKGHMKMHLLNILNQLEAQDEEIEKAKEYFKINTVSFSAVREFLEQSREIQ